MYVDLPIRSVKECRKLLENITDLPPGMFCAGYLEGGKDACQVYIFISLYVYI